MDSVDPVDPLDAETIAQLRELGDDEFLAELAEMFLTDFDPGLTVLVAAIDADDRTTAGSKAHFLKGSSLSIGLKRLSETLAQIERHFRDDGTAETLDERLVSDLHVRADEARVRLRMLLLESEESGISGR